MDTIIIWNKEAKEHLGRNSLLNLRSDLQAAHQATLPAHGVTPHTLHECPALHGLWWTTQHGTKQTLLSIQTTRPNHTFRKCEPEPVMEKLTTNNNLTPYADILRDYSCDQSALRYDWTKLAYTDGSVRKTPLPDGGVMNRIGAGVYIPTRGDGHARTQAREVTVNPGGHQSTNTINRAELSGIWAALQLKELEIATDSATSLSQLRKALLSPMDLRYHKHREMAGHVIKLIREILAEDPDIQITIYKIKAHNGRIGNECADITAKRATNISNQNEFNLNCPITDKPSFATSYWLRRASKDHPGQTE
jgi:ribonuclease HI